MEKRCVVFRENYQLNVCNETQFDSKADIMFLGTGHTLQRTCFGCLSMKMTCRHSFQDFLGQWLNNNVELKVH
jgi:hypothetical protein